LALLLPACQFPRDVDGTLSKVRGGEIRAGIVPNDPWVTFDDTRPGGVEVELLEQFAREQDAEIRWVRGAESELIEALEGGQLDVVIGGLTRDSTHQQLVTLTRPYATTEAIFAAPRGVEIPDDLDGVRVGVEAHSPEAAELERQTDAEPVPLESIEGFDGPVVVESHEADDLGLVKTNRSLAEEEHVFAVTHGENAFLTELEGFLLDRGQEAMRMLDREDAP
jgi:ABC-type amino acid transport substrate-binding protein